MARYDPGLIKDYADVLYSQAAFVAFAHAVAGLVLGGVLGFFASRTAEDPQTGWAVLLAAGVAGALGYWYGAAKGLRLKLEAQAALCQVHIEENTRVLAQAASRQADAPDTGHSG